MRTVFNELLLSSVALNFLVVALGRDTPVPFLLLSKKCSTKKFKRYDS